MSTTAITSDPAPFFTPTTLTLTVLSLVMIPAMFVTPAPFLQWLQRKRYQYEVTFSLYMLTPTEKFIFNSVLFILLSLIFIAASLYLPDHLFTVMKRAFYYVHGD